MSEFDDYESLPENVGLSVTMGAGAAAGIAEHCVMYPVDSIKTRMQSLDCEKQALQRGIFGNLRCIIKEEGLFRPMRGFSAMFAGAGPAHALYFSAYEHMKNNVKHFNSNIPEFWSQGIAGVSATLLHDGVMTPAEVVKQRMQMCCSPFRSVLTAIGTIYANEGGRAFYRSYFTSLSMNIPYQVTHFWTYEYVTNLLNPEKNYTPYVHFIAGASAGAVAATVTMPLDVCKTLLNTQEPSVLRRIKSDKIIGLPNAAKLIYQIKGFSGYFQGLRARVLYQMPATAISWSVYEFFKHYLSSGKDEINDYDTLSDLKSPRKEGELWDNLTDVIINRQRDIILTDIQTPNK